MFRQKFRKGWSTLVLSHLFEESIRYSCIGKTYRFCELEEHLFCIILDTISRIQERKKKVLGKYTML